MQEPRLNLNLLLILDSLLTGQGVSVTARRLGLSQPNVSHALAQLRAFFDDPLLVREGNRMRPTPRAERLRGPLRRVIDMLETEVLCADEFDPMTSERCFCLSMSDVGELTYLPALLAALRLRAPHLRLRSVSMPPGELERAMAENFVDLAVGYFPDLQGAAFYQQKLFDHPFICMLREGHAVLDQTLSLDNFLRLDHIVVSAEGRSQEIFEQHLAQLGLTRRVVLQSPHFMSAPFLIAQSDCITTVPEAVGRWYANLLPLRLLPPPLKIPPIELRQHWHRRVHHDPGVIWLRRLIAELFLNRDPTLASG